MHVSIIKVGIPINFNIILIKIKEIIMKSKIWIPNGILISYKFHINFFSL